MRTIKGSASKWINLKPALLFAVLAFSQASHAVSEYVVPPTGFANEYRQEVYDDESNAQAFCERKLGSDAVVFDWVIQNVQYGFGESTKVTREYRALISATCAVSKLTNFRVFDQTEYLSMNPDVASYYHRDPRLARRHWVLYGVNEGRRARIRFSPQEYLNMYSDLQRAFGWDLRRAAAHYVDYGYNERRVGRYALSPAVFNPNTYRYLYPDLVAAGLFTWSVDYVGTIYSAPAVDHWLNHGIQEGRRATWGFNPVSYLQLNPDVAAAYGATNYAGAIEHYIRWGRYEGRPR